MQFGALLKPFVLQTCAQEEIITELESSLSVLPTLDDIIALLHIPEQTQVLPDEMILEFWLQFL